MAQNSANVAAFSPPVAGGLLRAPIGTPTPTDATSALDAAFLPVGYIAEDGIQYSGDAPSTEDVVAWGGDVVATLESTKKVVRYTFKMLEVFGVNALKTVFGDDNVEVTPAAAGVSTKIAVTDKNVTPDPGVYVVEGLFKGKKARIVLGNGSPSVTGEDPWVHSALTGFEVQVTGLPDENGVTRSIYFDLNDATA